jgi:hypothetical protein
MKHMQSRIGKLNEESSKEETDKNSQQILRVSHIVNQVCGQTPWESKCLVRALTAQHLLKKKSISSTLYLGVGKEGNDMSAHAWLRSGKYYVTGGTGDGYALVTKFRA